MNSKNTTLDFSGQPIYIGLDVHKKSWKATICTAHSVQRAFIIENPFVNNLVKHLHCRFANGDYYCVYEAGFSGFWAQEQLSAKGIKTIVVNPADIPTTDKERQFKDDKRDSRKLSLSLRSGELQGIYVPDKEAQKDRSTVRARAQIASKQRRVKNQIKSTLHFYGIEIPEDFSNRHWSRRFVSWLEQVCEQKSLDGLRMLLDIHLTLRDHQLKATRKLREISRQNKYAKLSQLLRSVPGVGLLTQMLLLTEIVDINRFKTEDQLFAYTGLIPRTNSSGETQRTGEMTKRGNKRLKSALIESAWVAIRKDPQLLVKYETYRKRMGGHKAIVRVARILLRKIRSVWRNEQNYLITEF